jgi:peptide/nickel transport system substrate-binding protein
MTGSDDDVSRRQALWRLGAGGAVVGLAGCAGDGTGTATGGAGTDDGGRGTDTGGTGTGDGGETTENTADSGGGVQAFVGALGSEPDSLDVHSASRRPEAIVLSAINEPLFRVDPDKQAVPHLAADYESNADGTEHTVRLEEGVTFHDGEPLTADVAVWNLKRFAENSPYSARLGDFDAIEATGEREFVVRYGDPYPLLPRYLAYWNVGMVSRAAVEEAGEGYGTDVAVGTGPYQFEEWNGGESIRVSRNENYAWGPSWLENTGPAHLETLTFRIIPESTTLLQEVTAGEVHGSPYVPLADTGAVEDQSGTELHRLEYTRPGFLCLNTRKPPTDDLRVRKAIVHAIDRDPVIETSVGGEGYPIWNLVPPIAVNALGEERAKDLGQQFDPGRARALLAEAGWRNDGEGSVRTRDGQQLELTFLAFNIGRYATMAKTVQPMLESVGVSVELRVLEAGTLYNDLSNSQHHLVTMAGGGNYAADAIEPLLLGENDATEGGTNFSLWHNDAFDEAIATAKSSPDPEERRRAAIRAQELTLEEAPVAPILGYNKVYGNKTALSGLEEWKRHPWWPDRHYVKRLEFDL